MQKISFSRVSILCLSILAVFSGCKKQTSNQSKKSFFSKIKDKSADQSTKEMTDDSVNAFDLSNNDMKSFALDDHLQPTSHNDASINQPKEGNNLFSWEQLAADESKQEFKRLFFLFDKYSLQPDQLKNLKYDIKQAKKMIEQGKMIVIEGHACHSAGSAAYNLALSEKRARYVAKQFADAGIDSKNIKIAPRGQEMPLKKGGNREEQAVNRRVEIFAIDK
ncbi:OmpA family protein [Candidatus Dependentiae bacterium]|nr:OmpA family protein [Candidatus Dependentiae bacterium]